MTAETMLLRVECVGYKYKFDTDMFSYFKVFYVFEEFLKDRIFVPIFEYKQIQVPNIGT